MSAQAPPPDQIPRSGKQSKDSHHRRRTDQSRRDRLRLITRAIMPLVASLLPSSSSHEVAGWLAISSLKLTRSLTNVAAAITAALPTMTLAHLATAHTPQAAPKRVRACVAHHRAFGQVVGKHAAAAPRSGQHGARRR